MCNNFGVWSMARNQFTRFSYVTSVDSIEMSNEGNFWCLNGSRIYLYFLINELFSFDLKDCYVLFYFFSIFFSLFLSTIQESNWIFYHDSYFVCQLCANNSHSNYKNWLKFCHAVTHWNVSVVAWFWIKLKWRRRIKKHNNLMRLSSLNLIRSWKITE